MGKSNLDTLVLSTTGLGYTYSKDSNGTTPVNIFGTTNGFDGVLKSIIFLSKDDANGTIEVYSDVGTICKITTKGSIGTIKGTPLANTTFTADGTLKVVSTSGTGSVTVIANFVTT